MHSYVIGRSPHADIVLADPSVARRHAELLRAEDGRLFLTDCASDNGSWILDVSGSGFGQWLPIRQGFVEPLDTLRLGEFRCTPSQLLKLAGSEAQHHDDSPDGASALGPRNDATALHHGAVERDPHTGEIIRRRP